VSKFNNTFGNDNVTFCYNNNTFGNDKVTFCYNFVAVTRHLLTITKHSMTKYYFTTTY
jgi:hypothetical protein